MALTDKQIKELDLASQRKLGGTATDTDIKNLEYAYGKGYSYKPNQDLYIGATNWANLQQQYAPNVLEQATQRVGGDIFWNPNVNIEDLISQPVNAGEVTPSVPVVGTFGSMDKLMAGIDTSNKGLQAQLEQIMLPTQSQARKDQIDEQFRVATEEQKTAQRDLQEDTWARFGLEQNIEQLQSIMPQIAKVEADYMAMMEEIKNQPLSSRIIGGTADRLQRQKAVELAGLSAVAQAYQGNVDLARNITQDALNAQFQDQQNYLQNLRFQLDSVESNLSREEKRKADALNLVINEREREIAYERQQQEGIYEIMLIASQNGADASVVQKIMNSENARQAVLNAGQYLSAETTLDRYKKIGQDSKGNDIFYDNATGTIKTGDQLTFNQLGGQVGTINGLPAYDTRTANPGMNRSDRNNNPGNIKVSDYTKNFEGVVGVESNPAEDGGHFLIFDNSESGLNAIGRLLVEGRSYQGVDAETAIKRYNGGGSYGALDVGLEPYKNFQDQIKDPIKRLEVARNMAILEGWKGSVSVSIPDEVVSLLELVRTKRITEEKALAQVSKENKERLITELPKIKVQEIASSYTKEMKERTLQNVEELLKDVNIYTVGFGSTLQNQIKGTPAYNFAAKLDTIVANIAFSELNAMREASETGGALGQVSDREGKLLGSALGSLDQGQSPEQFRQQLNKIKDSINRWKEALDQHNIESGVSAVNLSDLDFKF